MMIELEKLSTVLASRGIESGMHFILTMSFLMSKLLSKAKFTMPDVMKVP